MTEKIIGSPNGHLAGAGGLIRACLALVGFGFVASTLLTPALGQSFPYPPVYSRITQPIDEGLLVPVEGHVHPLPGQSSTAAWSTTVCPSSA
jgi:hypothetical protein